MTYDMRHTVRRVAGRRGARVALVAAGFLILAGCRPIRVDYQTGQVTSEEAQYQVVPTTATVAGSPVDAVDIQVTSCNEVQFSNWTDDSPVAQDYALHPYVQITDASNKIIYENRDLTYQNAPGVSETDVAAGSLDPAHVIVPVGSAPTPLSISVSCYNTVGPPAGVHIGWVFPGCTTSDRTCAVTTDGSYQFSPY